MVADREAILKVTVGLVPPQMHVKIDMRKLLQGRPHHSPTLSTVVHHMIGPPHQSPTVEMAPEAVSWQDL